MDSNAHARQTLSEFRMGGRLIDVDNCLYRNTRFQQIQGNVVSLGVSRGDDSLLTRTDRVQPQ